jgi:carboxylesterase
VIPLILAASALAAYAARRAAAARTERELARRLPLAEKGIIRGAHAIERQGRDGRAALLLHGFGDTPQSLAYLAEHLRALGWTVRAPLLPGHGRTIRDFAASTAEAWLGAARDELAALRARHDRVALVGVSMGGALATALAAEERADGHALPALVLVAPYLSMPNWMRRLALLHPVWGLVAPYVHSRGERSIHDPAEQQRTLAFGVCTPRLLHELLRVMRLARAAAPKVSAPTLVVQSRLDNRIPPEACERAFALFRGPKELVWLERCGHVITVDYERTRVFDEVTRWLDAHVPHAGASAPDTAGEGASAHDARPRRAARPTPA